MASSEDEKVLNETSTAITVASPLDIKEKEVIDAIVDAGDKKELQAQFELFNINQSKKNALRVVKLQNLRDKVEDEIIERFDKRPDQVSNRELLEYMQTVSGEIDRSKKVVDTLQENEAIKVAGPTPSSGNTNVNINLGTSLNRDNKENVVDAIKSILNIIQRPQGTPEVINSEVTVISPEGLGEEDSE